MQIETLQARLGACGGQIEAIALASTCQRGGVFSGSWHAMFENAL